MVNSKPKYIRINISENHENFEIFDIFRIDSDRIDFGRVNIKFESFMVQRIRKKIIMETYLPLIILWIHIFSITIIFLPASCIRKINGLLHIISHIIYQ